MEASNLPATAFGRLQAGYTRFALNLANFFLLFVVVNVVIGFSFTFDQKVQQAAAIVHTNPTGRPHVTALRDPWQLEHIDTLAYGAMSQADIDQVLDDNTLLNRSGQFYQPWVQFASRPFQSRTVNVDADEDAEFPHRRSVSDTSVPGDGPVIDVYTFGGSTMFGFNVADRDTVASRLWNKLETRIRKEVPGAHVRVINYGRLLYYSTQEATLFNRLLRAGRRPRLAIFLDGLNDTIFMAGKVDQPNMTGMLQDLLESRQIGRRGTGLQDYTWIPMVRLAYFLRQKFATHAEAAAKPQIPALVSADDQSAFVLKTYRTNVAEIKRTAAAYGVQCCFFVQPVPFYHYDMSLTRTPPQYPPLLTDMYQKVYESLSHDPQVVFLGDALQQYGHRKVFVDDVHYGPDFADYLAGQMADHIDLKALTRGAR